MRLAFIIDPMAGLKLAKDTTLALMRSSVARQHEVFVLEQHDLWFERDSQLQLIASQVRIAHDGSFSVGVREVMQPDDFAAILMRKDPPFDMEYVYSTYLLESAEHKVKLINKPRALRDWNEKFSICYFPQYAPPFIVTAEGRRIRDFLQQHVEVVVKPLDGMGGQGVFRITAHDPNLGVIIETVTRHQTNTVMVQKYVPEIVAGDKRVLVINGKPVPYALARIPQAGESRGNLAVGGKGVAQALSMRDLEIAHVVGESLCKAGIFLAGLDIIGEYLTEINVTSPTGMVEIATQTDCNPAEIFLDHLEGLCGTL